MPAPASFMDTLVSTCPRCVCGCITQFVYTLSVSLDLQKWFVSYFSKFNFLSSFFQNLGLWKGWSSLAGSQQGLHLCRAFQLSCDVAEWPWETSLLLPSQLPVGTQREHVIFMAMGKKPSQVKRHSCTLGSLPHLWAGQPQAVPWPHLWLLLSALQLQPAWRKGKAFTADCQSSGAASLSV